MARRGFGARAAKSRSASPNIRMVGRMGRSQAVTTFGTGSIYELRTFRNGRATLHSVMVAGLDAWDRYKYDLQFVREDVLARILSVQNFFLPPVEPDYHTGGDIPVVPAVRFPELLSCDNRKCGRVGKVGREFSDPGMGGVRCNAAGCSGRGIPFRLVVACHDKKDPHQPGHIDDFPYIQWAHRGGETCPNPAIYLLSGKGTTGLGGLSLKCKACDRPPQPLAGVFSPKALEHLRCRGRRPWLHDFEPNCQRHLQVLQRGASNTYFPITASVLSIPPYSDRLADLVAKAMPFNNVQGLRNGALKLDDAIGLCRTMPGLDDAAVYSDQQIKESLLILTGQKEVQLPSSESEQRARERNAIVQGREETEEALDFVAELVTDLSAYDVLQTYLGKLVKVHRLREVRALRGFHRVESGFAGDSFRVEVAPLNKRRLEWLPAIEVRGEGVYVELPEEKLAKWERHPAVLQRVGVIAENLRRVCERNGWPVHAVAPREILVHTLSHLLMKQLALECGYSGNSLRERLYVQGAPSEPFAGLLIYTASTAADGTLGGLVSQGEPERLAGILAAALLSARWCSSDPLCGESKGQGIDALNMSACHACALISETSCEKRNILLDRALITGVPGQREAGFFAGFLEWAA